MITLRKGPQLAYLYYALSQNHILKGPITRRKISIELLIRLIWYQQLKSRKKRLPGY